MWDYVCPSCSQYIDEKDIGFGLCPKCGYHIVEGKEKLRVPPRWIRQMKRR